MHHADLTDPVPARGHHGSTVVHPHHTRGAASGPQDSHAHSRQINHGRAIQVERRCRRSQGGSAARCAHSGGCAPPHRAKSLGPDTRTRRGCARDAAFGPGRLAHPQHRTRPRSRRRCGARAGAQRTGCTTSASQSVTHRRHAVDGLIHQRSSRGFSRSRPRSIPDGAQPLQVPCRVSVHITSASAADMSYM